MTRARRPRPPRLALAAALLALAAGTAGAQDTLVVIRPLPPADTTPREPPAEAVQRAMAVYNDSATTRITGSFTLPAGSRITGRVAVYRGNLRVYGRITGPVTVINGDLIVASGGVVDGDAFVVGGVVELRERGLLTGDREEYDGFAPVYRTPGGLLALRDRRRPLGELATARASFTTGRIHTTLSLETGRTYNRVEGLPILFGPTFTATGPSGVEGRLDVRGIFRPATDRTNARDDLGFVVTAEFTGGGPGRILRFGGRGYRRIQSIEDQPLAAGEAGWSAFLLQRDYRDHYDARGIEVFGSVEPLRGLRLGGSLRRDLERSVPASDPISLFRNSEQWRPNPLIDDGHFRTARLDLTVDTRNDPARPTTGWWVRAEVERSASNDAAPVTLPADVRPPMAPGPYAFSRLWFDARRYARFNPTTVVGLRVVGGGWLGGDPLPVQRRVSLGGPDILPGFGFRDLNCTPPGVTDQARASLCDRMLAVQFEARFDLNLGLPFRIRNPDVAVLQQILGIEQADLVVFGGAGKAWLTGDGPGRVPNDRIPVLREWDADAGIGLDAGGIAVYAARALTADQPFRLVLRLQHRF
jgi:hypothetical protein